MKDIYVKFDSPAIKGESQDKDHKDWIEINSWSQAISQPRSATASTAGVGSLWAPRRLTARTTYRYDAPILTLVSAYQHSPIGSEVTRSNSLPPPSARKT